MIASNGFADGPAQALRDFLLAKHAARVTTVFHPLGREDGSVHLINRYEQGRQVASTKVWLPSRPPLTYPLDLLVPPWPGASDAWFGFNATACLRGLAARRSGRARQVVYWCVDYVDDRFGKSLLTKAYERLDGLCCRQADARIELSSAALQARNRRHDGARLAPARVVPMGAWTQRTPKTPADGWQTRRVAYLGHLVPRQGVKILIDAIALLNRRGFPVTADIIGGGPDLGPLRLQAEAEGIADRVRFHGFLKDHRRAEAILADCSVGVAPYLTDAGSFTRFADPGKLKAYLGAALPIVMTPVPPIARELVDAGAALLVDASAESLADGVRAVLQTAGEWQRLRDNALKIARRYDWEILLRDALGYLGFADA